MSYLNEKYGDVGMPTEWERRRLGEMMYRAFLEIRNFAQQKPEQMADLADAFHNLPIMIYSEDFSMKYFRFYLETYQDKYSNERGENYLEMLDKIIKEENP